MLGERRLDVRRLVAAARAAGVQRGQHVAAQRVVHHVRLEMVAQGAELHRHLGERRRLSLLAAIAAAADQQHDGHAQHGEGDEFLLDAEAHDGLPGSEMVDGRPLAGRNRNRYRD